MTTESPARGATEQEWRRGYIIRQLLARAGRWHRLTGDGVRYVIEGYVKDAAPGEWDWAQAWFRANQDEVMAQPDRSDAEILAWERDNAAVAAADARDAYDADDFELALYLISLGEWWHPGCIPWARIREAVTRAAATFAAVSHE